jgi:hypothetical protein
MTTPSAHGPDTSHYQTYTGEPLEPAWLVHSLKCSEGGKAGDGGDPKGDRFAQRWALLEQLGIRYPGAYHVLLGNVPVALQAENFCRRVDAVGGIGHGFAQCDWENWKSGLASSDQVIEWCDLVDAHYGRPCTIVYCGAYIGDSQYDTDLIPEFAEWRAARPDAPWWLANYVTATTNPRNGWGLSERFRAAVWQWTSTYRHPSIVTSSTSPGFDMNHVFDWATLDRLCGYVAGDVDQPTPTPPVLEEDAMYQFIWNPKGFANAFLCGSGPALQLSPSAYAAAVAAKVPIVAQDDHPQMLDSVLHQAGLRHADLTPLT